LVSGDSSKHKSFVSDQFDDDDDEAKNNENLWEVDVQEDEFDLKSNKDYMSLSDDLKRMAKLFAKDLKKITVSNGGDDRSMHTAKYMHM